MRSGLASPAPAKAARPAGLGRSQTFTEEIEPADGPILHFLHVLLPHKAWRYLPSGERYSDTVGSDAELGGLEEWDDDEWPVLQAEQRFLLQLGYTDRLLGGVMDKLRAEGLYDESLIVVAADHGVCVPRRRPAARRDRDQRRRHPLGAPVREAAGPEPRARSTRPRPGPFDVVPTIADAIGADIPWEVDGESLLSGTFPTAPSRWRT